eukprot:TRINITY_DN11797_c0_g1_i1.p1 TRINITY_DN11797_c0_g1~~TRINITY_DN11797_c0_g1_i1.p1  ORF type:complete len:314 (+),score=142.07 TRINITY_DN11797_c0_g1_i1:64-1005(+)
MAPQRLTEGRLVKGLECMFNVRDVGGLGGMKKGVLYRSDDPVQASEADQKVMAAVGLRTVLDLRTDLEVDMKGKADFGAKRFACELPPNAKVVAKTIGVQVQKGYADGPPGMARSNKLLLDVGKESFAAGLRAIIRPGGVPALVHCRSGKDRTGLFVMLVQSFAGVSDDDIAADYALTSELLPRAPDALAAAKAQFTRYTGAAVDDKQAENILGAHPDSAHRTLAMIRDVHGGPEQYIRRVLRFSGAEVAALRAALTGVQPPAVPAATPAWKHPGVLVGAAAAAFGLSKMFGSSAPAAPTEKQEQKTVPKAKL